ncbi:hypothetical protein BDF14DRAFT_1751592 [Spinellus fusiger]|nr:hypothetical protein BDF14DRAFT_1751592 [Spinellus fusiger]
MQSIQVKEPGDASQLYIGDYPRPTPSNTQLLVKVQCFSLNRADLQQRQGINLHPPGVSPILGMELSGTVVSVGEQVTRFKQGDAVFGLVSGGAYAEYAVMEDGLTILKPKDLSFETAASIPEAWFTAYQCLFHVAHLLPQQDVLIHAGASSVDIAAIQLARHNGARRIFVTVGSDEKVAFCESLGATCGIHYKKENWADRISQETQGRGVDIIVDFIGKDYWQDNLNSLAMDGCMVLLGLMSGSDIEHINMSPLLKKRLRIEGSTLRNRSLEYKSRLCSDVNMDVIQPHFANGQTTYKLILDKIFDWKDIIEAHRYLESNVSKGKVVVCVHT